MNRWITPRDPQQCAFSTRHFHRLLLSDLWLDDTMAASIPQGRNKWTTEIGMVWDGVEIIKHTANGIEFEIATLGTGDRLALCLHGFPEHAYSWRFQMPMLARLGYRVWAPNLRGYGGTTSPREIAAYQTTLLVDDVLALIDVSGAREVLLVAHDWGAVLAWMIAM